MPRPSPRAGTRPKPRGAGRLPAWAQEQLDKARKRRAPKRKLRISRVVVFPGKRTSAATIRALADVPVGALVTDELLQQVRERLVDSRLFKQVEVYWEKDATRPDQAILYIECQDKFTWFVVPLFTWQEGHWGGALAYGNANLFGLGVRFGVLAKWLVDDQMLAVGYEDPHIRQTHFLWRWALGFRRSLYREYIRLLGPVLGDAEPARTVWFHSLFGLLRLGYEFWGKLDVEVGYNFALVAYGDATCPGNSEGTCASPAEATASQWTAPMAHREGGLWRAGSYAGPEFWRYHRDAFFEAILGYDAVVDTFGIKRGWKVRGWIEVAHPYLGSEFRYVRWYVSAYAAFRFFHEHMLELSAAHGQSYGAPLHKEFGLGGSSLPGYVFNQARGDTLTTLEVAYTVPLFKVWWLSFRQVFYYDLGYIFFRDGGRSEPWYDDQGDWRRYHLPHEPGPGSRAALLQSVGTGLRLYAKIIALPLLGIDVAYGFEANAVRFLLFVGTEY